MPSASELIDALGGTTQVARLLGLKPPSVHEWRTKHIPLQWLVLLAVPIEKATTWRRWDLRPKDWYRIWPELVGQQGAPQVALGEAGDVASVRVQAGRAHACAGQGPCQQRRLVVEGTLCLNTALPMLAQPGGALRCEMCDEFSLTDQAAGDAEEAFAVVSSEGLRPGLRSGQ